MFLIGHVKLPFGIVFFFLKKMFIKGALSGLRQFLATESSLKMMKKSFLVHLESSFYSQDI